VDAYLTAAQIANDRKGPLFRSLDRERCLTERRLHRPEVLAMIKRRTRQAELPETTCCHTFRRWASCASRVDLPARRSPDMMTA
jgi:integrase/recombinase XerD